MNGLNRLFHRSVFVYVLSEDRLDGFLEIDRV